MKPLGYDVTVVEIGPSLRTGGTAVDIKRNTVDIVRRMGSSIRFDRLSLRRWEMKNADDHTERALVMRAEGLTHDVDRIIEPRNECFCSQKRTANRAISRIFRWMVDREEIRGATLLHGK